MKYTRRPYQTQEKVVICEPLRDGVFVNERLVELNPGRVLLIFWHGVGDLVMFLPTVDKLKDLYPCVEFKVGVPKGLSYLDLCPDAIELSGDEVNDDSITAKLGFDLVVKITFPMSEGQTAYTKGEWCCIHEIGIPPIWQHGILKKYRSRLCTVHFQITCLPDSCNPDEIVAERIWNDVLSAAWIPLEVHFEHIFHNPVNKKFRFVDAHVRRCKPELRSLVSLIQSAGAFVGVVSGPFHIAMATLPPHRVLLLEKDFKREHFTKANIRTANVREYQGEVLDFLKNLDAQPD
jgi:hypothetical protein